MHEREGQTMPLRDHFRGWLRREIEWGSFCCAWASGISAALNGILPEGFRAVPDVRAGTEIWHDESALFSSSRTVPFEPAGVSAEVLVHGSRDGRYLAAAIELVTEDDHRQSGAFTSKSETYLRRGVGLIIFDAVTTHDSNLHDELMARVGGHGLAMWRERLYATAYQPGGKNGIAELAVWQQHLALGTELPTMPLWLLYGPCVPVHLESTYEDTFRQLRLPTEEP